METTDPVNNLIEENLYCISTATYLDGKIPKTEEKGIFKLSPWAALVIWKNAGGSAGSGRVPLLLR